MIIGILVNIDCDMIYLVSLSPSYLLSLCTPQVADITFNVWYRLSEELIKLNDEQLCEMFKPYVQRLVSHLCVHCQLDEDTSPVSYFYS